MNIKEVCCFDAKKVRYLYISKKLKRKYGLVMILRTVGKGRIKIVKDVWRSNGKSLDLDMFCGKRGLDNKPKLLLQVLKN